jgi:putative acetyltransferase
MMIRDTTGADFDAVFALVTLAFRDARRSSGTEAAIVAGLRDAGALAQSLVAVDQGAVIGYVAFSPVEIGQGTAGWFALGPLAVAKAWRRRGVGAGLVWGGLGRLQAAGVGGCVVLGDPDYYSRFGFRSADLLRYGHVPVPHLQFLSFDGATPAGDVTFHPAFAAG